MSNPKKAATTLGITLLVAVGAAVSAIGSPFIGVGDEVEAMVRDLAKGIRDNYVFPDKGEQAAEMLEANLESGNYDDLDDMQIAQRLTQDLQELTKDRHFGVRPAPRGEPGLDAMVRRGAPPSGTHGFERVERLEGNIGYLDLRRFEGLDESGPTLHAAMRMLQGSDALIFDMRRNGGGHPGSVQAICSYLFDPGEPVHLNSLYFRPTDETTEFWTMPEILESGAMPETPVWVLTSSYTFSGAEEFTYNLKTRGRATIVGETTGGGAHPVDGFPIGDGSHMAMIPVGRAINPITKTNWEGTGVTPDVEAPAEEALDVAVSLALEAMMDSGDPGKAETASWALVAKRAAAGGQPISEADMMEIAGDYGERQVQLRDGALWYSRSTSTSTKPRRLTCVGDDTFVVQGVPEFKLVFERSRDGRITAVSGNYKTRGPDRNDRVD